MLAQQVTPGSFSVSSCEGSSGSQAQPWTEAGLRPRLLCRGSNPDSSRCSHPANHRIPSQAVPCLPLKIQITQSSARLLPALQLHPCPPGTGFQCCKEDPLPLAPRPLAMPLPSPTPPSSLALHSPFFFRLEFGCSPQEVSLSLPRPLAGPTAPLWGFQLCIYSAVLSLAYCQSPQFSVGRDCV